MHDSDSDEASLNTKYRDISSVLIFCHLHIIQLQHTHYTYVLYKNKFQGSNSQNCMTQGSYAEEGQQ